MIVIGIGTGRSGTVSLCRILQECRNIGASHEDRKIMIPFGEKTDDDLRFNLLYLRSKAAEYKNNIFCDIASFNTGHIKRYLELELNIRVIALHRDIDSTTASWMRKCNNYSRCRPEDSVNFPASVNMAWTRYFPKFKNTKSSKDAWHKYWHWYEDIIKDISKDPRVINIDMEDLNNSDKLRKVFNFIGVPVKDMMFSEKRIYNKSEQY